MARFFLTVYVAIHLIVIVVNVAVNVFGDESIQLLTKDDWLIFIIACGVLAICESIEKKGESK